jgi:hypothetical protein
MDVFLGELCSMWKLQPHKAVVLVEILPAWLRFLEMRSLLREQQRTVALKQLADLIPPLLQGVAREGEDPALRESLERWPREAELDL